MNKYILPAVLAALFISGVCTARKEARLLRFPATNGNEIVFTYAGDLWTVPAAGGEARRLTSHLGYEAFARFSPDGKQIAFTGEYDGKAHTGGVEVSVTEDTVITYSTDGGETWTASAPAITDVGTLEYLGQVV